MRPLLIAFALLTLGGCEQAIAVDVSVTVPAEVQALYSRRAPGRLMLGMDVPKTSVGWYSLRVLCEPGEQPLVATFHYEGRGCARAGTVRAWVVPAAEVDCSLPASDHAVRFDAAPGPTPDSPQGTATVFADATGSAGCESGTAQVEITLARP
jgi:hypothetical protein